MSLSQNLHLYSNSFLNFNRQPGKVSNQNPNFLMTTLKNDSSNHNTQPQHTEVVNIPCQGKLYDLYFLLFSQMRITGTHFFHCFLRNSQYCCKKLLIALCLFIISLKENRFLVIQIFFSFTSYLFFIQYQSLALRLPLTC